MTPRSPAAAERLDFIAVLGFALTVRVALFFDAVDAPFWNVPLVDETAYLDLARRLRDGVPPPSGAWYGSPGYAYVLWAFDALGAGPLLVKLVQLASGVATSLCITALARPLAGRTAAVVAGIAWSLVPAALLQELLLLKTTFATTAALAGLVAVMEARRQEARRRRFIAFVASGVFFAAAVLLRGELLIAVAAVLLTVAWPDRRQRHGALVAAAIVAGAIAVPALQNARWSGAFAPLGFAAGVNFYIGNHAGADGGYVPLRPDRSDPPQEEADAVAVAAEGLRPQSATPDAVSRWWFEQGLAWWRESPLAALRLTFAKWAMLWGPHELADTLSTTQAARWVRLLELPPFVAAIALPLAAAGLWILRRSASARPLVVFVLAGQCAIVPFFLFERFRLHLLAASLPLAAVALVGVIAGVRGRRLRTLVVPLVIAIAVAALTAPRRAPRDEAVLRVNIGELFFQAGRYEEAEREFEAVRQSSPAAWRVDLNLANVHAALGREVEARAALERVLVHLHAEGDATGRPSREELALGHERAGDLALRAGDRAAAGAHFDAALEFAAPDAVPAIQRKRDALASP